MLITREVALRLLSVNNTKFPEFVKQGKLTIKKTGFGGRKYYDRTEVIKLGLELKKAKEL